MPHTAIRRQTTGRRAAGNRRPNGHRPRAPSPLISPLTPPDRRGTRGRISGIESQGRGPSKLVGRPLPVGSSRPQPLSPREGHLRRCRVSPVQPLADLHDVLSGPAHASRISALTPQVDGMAEQRSGAVREPQPGRDEKQPLGRIVVIHPREHKGNGAANDAAQASAGQYVGFRVQVHRGHDSVSIGVRQNRCQPCRRRRWRASSLTDGQPAAGRPCRSYVTLAAIGTASPPTSPVLCLDAPGRPTAPRFNRGSIPEPRRTQAAAGQPSASSRVCRRATAAPGNTVARSATMRVCAGPCGHALARQ